MSAARPGAPLRDAGQRRRARRRAHPVAGAHRAGDRAAELRVGRGLPRPRAARARLSARAGPARWRDPPRLATSAAAARLAMPIRRASSPSALPRTTSPTTRASRPRAARGRPSRRRCSTRSDWRRRRFVTLKTRAAVYVEVGKPMVIDEVELPDPRPDPAAGQTIRQRHLPHAAAHAAQPRREVTAAAGPRGHRRRRGRRRRRSANVREGDHVHAQLHAAAPAGGGAAGAADAASPRSGGARFGRVGHLVRRRGRRPGLCRADRPGRRRPT